MHMHGRRCDPGCSWYTRPVPCLPSPHHDCREEGSHVNTGVYALRSNNGTNALVDSWLSMRHKPGRHNDQTMFGKLATRDYVMCGSRATCAAARMTAKPVVLRHPAQFGSQGTCPDATWDVPCDPVRLFVHAICRVGWGPTDKGSVLEKYHLWLLDADLRPLYNEDDEAWRHPFLPCQGAAWQDHATEQ
eukprot:365946-Chlamydomonas_euryale.AAC.10